MSDRLAHSADETEERRQHVRRIAFGFGLTDAQIDDVERLIDRIASETPMTRQAAESFVDSLSDFDDDMRAQFEADCLGGAVPMHVWPAWFSLARDAMTQRKGERLKKSLGLTE